MIKQGAALLTAAEMRAAEATAIAGGVSAEVLMGRAAVAAAAVIRESTPLRSALVLCGPGNNGGDGFGVASELQAAGMAVRVACDVLPAVEPAAGFAARWTGPLERLASAAPAPLIIDALFGTGLTRMLAPDIQIAVDRLRCAGATIIALDLPSGIDADTGAALGLPLSADVTIAFGVAKRGHAFGAGRRAAGRRVVVDIGVVPTADAARLVAPPIMVGLADDTHKYRRGGVLVIDGEQRGAAQLTALAALRTGAGAVTLVGADGGVPAHAVMRCDDDAALALLDTVKVRAVAIGPGLADNPRSRDWLRRLLAGTTPVVIDAGALALVADGLATASAPLVLTPHGGEFARLFGAPGGDLIGAVRAAAGQARAVVVAKGRETIIAAPDGRVAVNTHASPWLATAGSGDCLTGIIAALLAQGMAPFDAAQAGVWLHGDAGIRGGPGLIADDIPAMLPAVLAGL